MRSAAGGGGRTTITHRSGVRSGDFNSISRTNGSSARREGHHDQYVQDFSGTRATAASQVLQRDVGIRKARKMSRFVRVFLRDEAPVQSIVTGLGWRPVDQGRFAMNDFGWEAEIVGPRSMSAEDAPPEALAMEPGIAWYCEATVETDEFEFERTAVRRVVRAVTAIAHAGHGVIANEKDLWRPGSKRRVKWSVPREPEMEPAWLTMIWWTLDRSLTTGEKLRPLLENLDRVLPGAIPIRWGDCEPLAYSLDRDGISGLVQCLRSSGPFNLATVMKPPFVGFRLADASLLGRSMSPEGPRTLQIDAGESIIAQPGWGHRLAVAFREISVFVQPFYAEARLLTRSDNTATLSPVDAHRWRGFPRSPPMAMVVGPPYREEWSDDRGQDDGDLVIYNSIEWPHPPEGGCSGRRRRDAPGIQSPDRTESNGRRFEQARNVASPRDRNTPSDAAGTRPEPSPQSCYHRPHRS